MPFSLQGGGVRRGKIILKKYVILITLSSKTKRYSAAPEADLNFGR